MDNLGSVLKVVDSSGNVKNSYYYDHYSLSLNKSETVSNPWQYAGGYYDANTGLYKFGTRYYDPQTGRWTQKDPVGGGYIYAGNNPVSEVDPSGTTPSTLVCFGVAGAAFLGALGLGGGSANIGTALANIFKSAQELVDALEVVGIDVAEKFVPVIGWAILAVQIIFATASAIAALKAAQCIS